MSSSTRCSSFRPSRSAINFCCSSSRSRFSWRANWRSSSHNYCSFSNSKRWSLSTSFCLITFSFYWWMSFKSFFSYSRVLCKWFSSSFKRVICSFRSVIIYSISYTLYLAFNRTDFLKVTSALNSFKFFSFPKTSYSPFLI